MQHLLRELQKLNRKIDKQILDNGRISKEDMERHANLRAFIKDHENNKSVR